MKELTDEARAILENRAAAKPRFLIEIQLDQLYRFSTQAPFQWYGDTFVSGRISDLRVSQSRATFGIVDTSMQHIMPALQGEYKRAPVRIWWAVGPGVREPYFESDYHEPGLYEGEDDPVPLLVFVGRIASFSQLTTVLGVVATRAGGQTFPRLRVLPPLANFTRPAGTVITWGGTNYRLESRG